MDSLTWVILANAVVWLGIGGYVAYLAACQRALASRIRHMEMLNND